MLPAMLDDDFKMCETLKVFREYGEEEEEECRRSDFVDDKGSALHLGTDFTARGLPMMH